MSRILVFDYSLRTCDCRSHLFTQIIRGNLMFWPNAPSGSGSSYFYSFSKAKVFLSGMMNTSIFRPHRTAANYIPCKSLRLGNDEGTFFGHDFEVGDGDTRHSLQFIYEFDPPLHLPHEVPGSSGVKHHHEHALPQQDGIGQLGIDLGMVYFLHHVDLQFGMGF